jgi:hypothetical protein
MARYHKKRDGILRIADDGSARFLRWWEVLAYRFGCRL